MAVVFEKPKEVEAVASPIERQRVRVTPRAFGLGLLLSLAMCAVMPYNDYYIAATYLSGSFFPIGALAGLLLIVLGINPVLIAMGRRPAIWTPQEIMTVWAMMLVVAGIPSSGLMRYLIPHIVAPHYYANAANGWEATILSHVPSRLLVHDPAAVRQFFEGIDRGQPIPWGAWAEPLGWWGLFAGLLFLAFFCLSALLRRQWVDHEKFAFPLVQLPLMLSETPEPGHRFNSLLRSPLLWFGAACVTAIHTIKGAHLFYPVVPDIPTVWHSDAFLNVAPWDSVNDIQFAIYPLIIGFAYLLSSEVSLSLWLFYLAFKAQILWAGMHDLDMATTGVGYSMGPAFITYQETGGVMMMGIWLLVSMRAHLRDVWRKAIHKNDALDDSNEPMSYRFAMCGLLAAYGGLFFWMTFVANVQPLMSVGVLTGSFLVFLVLSWLVAQAGLLFVTHTFASSQIMTVLVGTRPFDASTLAVASLAEHVGWQDPRELMAPSLLNASYGAGQTLDARSLTRALTVCVVLSTIVAAVSSIWLPYTHRGGIALQNPFMYINAPQLSLRWTAATMHDPKPVNVPAILHMAAGAGVVLLAFVARTRLLWFNIHPAGMLVASSWAMYMLWFSLMIGWMIKAPLMRYGGVRAYRVLLPFFLGLILGDCLNALGWVAIGAATGKGYLLLPN